MPQIKRKVALVTGAGQRIGREIALDLAANGWCVGVHYNRSREEADEVVTNIIRDGGRAVALHADLSRESQAADLIPRAVEELGELTCLVNNASAFEPDEISDATRESWDMHIEVNLRAPFVLTQGFARQLGAQSRGCIIHMLDERVWNLTPHLMTYTLSKSALWTLTRTSAMALAPRIRVNAVGPGASLRGRHQSEEHFQAMAQNTPLQRGGPPEEICHAVRFILASPSLTGQMIALDGGEHMGWCQPAAGFVPVGG
jgi:NAD(P)-dependent dehydrogenase (short-subunit alcohol dehydrogenase family)